MPLFSNELEKELIAKAQAHLHDRIELGEFNGDVQENMLLVLLSINRRVGSICSNPLVILGDYFVKYPKLAVLIGIIMWILLGVVSLTTVIGGLKALGLEVVQIVVP